METRQTHGLLSRLAIIISAGSVVAIFTVIASVSFASLIFAPPLDPFVASGIRVALTTAVVAGAWVALTSSYTGAIAIPQDRVAPILAILTAGIAAQMPSATPQDKCLAVLSAIILVSLTTGLFLYLLGRFQLGNLIRYIPYPVIGGFLAGSGWLLVMGGIRVATGLPVRLGILFHKDLLLHWAPAAVFGAVLFWILRRAKKQFYIPVLLPLTIG